MTRSTYEPQPPQWNLHLQVCHLCSFHFSTNWIRSLVSPLHLDLHLKAVQLLVLMKHMLFVSTKYNICCIRHVYVCKCVFAHVCQCPVLENGLTCIKRLKQMIMTFKSKHKTICQMETGTGLVKWRSTFGFRVTKPAHTLTKQITWPLRIIGLLRTGKRIWLLVYYNINMVHFI